MGETVMEERIDLLSDLLRRALPFVRCPNEPCECGRDALYDEIEMELGGDEGGCE